MSLAQGYLLKTESRIRKWLMRNQPHYEDSSELTRKRIYILPTRAGMCLACLLLAMLMTALNYMNSMAMMFTFFVASSTFVTAYYTQRNLDGLKIRRVPQESFFVDQPAYFKIAVDNESNLDRYGILFRERNANLILHNIPASGSTEVKMPFKGSRRGEFKLRRFDAATRMPVGLFHAWSWHTIETSVWIYPAPIANNSAPVAPGGDSSDGSITRNNGQEFSSLREYIAGDPIKHIAWKQQARHGRLLTKEFNDNLEGNSSIFDWDYLTEEDSELKLSFLCYWLLEAEKSQHAYGLKLPDLLIPANKGKQHLETCLLALAKYPQ